jgi:predicted ABC-class ATPase
MNGYSEAKTMIENRSAPRHRVFKHGTVAFRSGGSIDCTVRNISSSGARIDVAIPIRLPQSFTLIIEADQFMRHCHPVWSSNQRIGIAFDQG